MALYTVKVELPTGGSFTTNLDGNIYISPHFQLWEVANTKGDVKLPQFVINEKTMDFFSCLEELRNYCGVGMKCNSCYRQAKYNKSVGGSSNSLHLDGLAFDWGKSNYNDTQRNNVKNKWEQITKAHGKVGGINYYTNGFHLSYDESKFGSKNFVFRDYRNKPGDW